MTTQTPLSGTHRPAIVSAVGSGIFASLSEEYLAHELASVGEVIATVDSFETPEAVAALERAEVLVTGWGTPPINGELLDRAPHLRWILHIAGSVKGMLAPEVWDRGIGVSSAVDANAVPVAEFTLAAILLSNKRIVQIARQYRNTRTDLNQAELGVIGNYRRRVGIVGASRIGRRVIDLLQNFDVDVVVSDPTVAAADVRAMGAEPASLEELCATCDVVSVHAPSLPTTRGLISRELIASMRPGSTLINTARGDVVDQDALTERVLSGDLFSVLDVTVPWVLPAEHPLYDHPNVLLTPHIAGSVGTEVDRMIDDQVGELRRIARGEPLAHPVQPEALATSA
ncbi:hydroxyacid dehydrogenase [Microbacterium amylolyticum]|uniref:Phosphoglycerate dehydrogenase-like enzyme n=1 Tax=Microbacterium amylolyticum TaxID=936337 RepID=A0ABS4ZGM8_9MICO|nr:hydroxyacid dehydrogenase [Microbacterium amylolyticum]MBP2436367.1 phosphoglycerate dehydrogenase-like enzyme [Microbacterium amylolyticum]